MWEGRVRIYDTPRIFNNFPTPSGYHPNSTLTLNTQYPIPTSQNSKNK